MKQLTSPYRRSQLSKNFFGLAIFVSLGLVQACTSKVELPASLGGSKTYKYGKQSSEGNFTTYLKTSSASCFEGKPKSWEVFFSTEFGKQRAQIDFPDATSSMQKPLVTIGSYSAYIDTNYLVTNKTAALLCTKELAESQQDILQDDDKDLLFSSPNNIAPDCHFKFKNGELLCEQKKVSKREALKDVKKLKKKLLRKWSRHPYLLARKLSISYQLASAVQSSKSDKLDRVCRVVEASLKEELPYAISMPRWKNTACNKDLEYEKEFLLFFQV